MRWRKWWRRRIAFLTALMLIVATVHPVFASDEWTDEFEGWTDNAKEETYLSYEITDWLALSSDLVTDANTVGVSVKAINLSNKVNKLRSKVKKAIKPLSYGVIHDKDYYVELMLAIIQAVSNGKPSGNDYPGADRPERKTAAVKQSKRKRRKERKNKRKVREKQI